MPREYSLDNTRNIGIIAHNDALFRKVFRNSLKPRGFNIFLYGKSGVYMPVRLWRDLFQHQHELLNFNL